MIQDKPPKLSEREKFFVDRIMQRVYRNDSCNCEVSQQVYRDGLVIRDKFHAIYLADLEADYAADGNQLRYFDTREEVLEYEKALAENKGL